MESLEQRADRPQLSVRHEALPLERAARERRGLGDVAHVVVAEIMEGTRRGRGECVPFARYGETIEEVVDTIESLTDEVANGLSRRGLQQLLPVGAARNALDLALWDLDSKRNASSAWQIAGLPLPKRLTTAFTIAFADADRMASIASEEADRPLLKLDLGGPGDLDRITAVRAAAPNSTLIIDAHEAWDVATLSTFMPQLEALGVALIEQPVPAGTDESLRHLPRLVPLCADESCRDRHGLDALIEIYDVINIKLDKVGGFTEALAMMEMAAQLHLAVMVSGTLSSSLALAPAVLLAQEAKWIDIDAGLLLRRDRQPGLRYEGSVIYPPSVSLWG